MVDLQPSSGASVGGAAHEEMSSRDKQLAQVLAQFAHTLGTDFSSQEILDHLVHHIVDILPITGAGVMVMDEDTAHMSFVAASNDAIMVIERLQNELDDGPCMAAYQTNAAVSVSDLRTDKGFPRFSPRAQASGLAAVFAFPMRLQGERLGAVDLYRDSPGALTEHDMQVAQVLADVAAAYLFNARSKADMAETVSRLTHRSLHDPLTGLANRALLEVLLERAIARASRSHATAAVLFVDLDGFKGVNDRYGHHVGDQLLRATATRLSQSVRPGDSLARLGGDEFVVLCEDLHDPSEAETVARRITSELSRPFDVNGRRISVTASVGVAFSGPGEELSESLIRDADYAMYLAKTEGGGRHSLLRPAARLAAQRANDLEIDLQLAERRQQLSLAYQPIVDARRGKLVTVEALLRWQHPEHGPITPDVVIPSAERTGQIVSLGDWVLRRALKDLQLWMSEGLPVRQVAVNVSPRQVMEPAFCESVRRVLIETGTAASALCLEVTESVLLADAPRALAVLQEVKEIGVKLSLDDFGTGYSSLSYLRQFPFDIVKIDRSFIADISTDQVTRSIVRSMIELSHVLELTVVAEGVETSHQLADVTALGADHVQGFHCSKPLSAGELGQFVSA